VVEHYLHTVGVAGSKPAARTILCFQWFPTLNQQPNQGSFGRAFL
jgi:hypothetical protein